MHYLYLGLAIVLEVAGTTNMKLSEGFTKPLPSILIFVFYGASFALLTLALRKIEVSTAYAVWSGLGMVLISLIGFIWFRETVSVLKIVSLAVIIAGVVGLHLADAKAH